MKPEFDDEKAINPFDLWAGANFKLKIRKVEGYRNYDKSEFADAGPLLDDDAQLESIWKQEYSLKEITDKKNFKSYDVLKARLDKALGFSGVAPMTKAEDVVLNKEVKTLVSQAKMPEMNESEDEDLDYFKSLAEKE
jgi:hypothetical protein